MTNDTSNEEREEASTPEPKRAYNPYESADPIPVPAYSRHMEAPDHEATFSTPRRSRTIQSARDAAHQGRRQQSASRRSQAADALLDPRESRDGKRPSPERAALMGGVPASERSALPTKGNLMRRDPSHLRFVIAVAAILIVLIAGLSVFAAMAHRPVTITVNGKTAEIPAGSTLEEVMDAQGVIVNPGNYVTVSGQMIEKHSGYAFSVQLNGQDLAQDELEAYRIHGSESIVFGDGNDRIEEYEATTETITPYLRMEGDGYALQYVSQWAREGVIEHRRGLVSGEEADVTTQEPKDCVITCRSLELDGDEKLVALTFDDGPADPYTEEYLDILDRYGAKATFFNLGDNVLAYPELARRIVAEGHQIANHTMAHNQLTAVDADTVRSEIARSAQAINDTCHVATTHIRPPYGDFTERSWLYSGGMITAAIRWSGDSQDWRLPGVDAIVENTLAGVHSGSILLMHDGGGDRSEDVDALPKIIEQLQDDGYTLVTVSDLMRAAGDIPEEVCSGTGTMPDDAVWPDEIAPEDLAGEGETAS